MTDKGLQPPPQMPPLSFGLAPLTVSVSAQPPQPSQPQQGLAAPPTVPSVPSTTVPPSTTLTPAPALTPLSAPPLPFMTTTTTPATVTPTVPQQPPLLPTTTATSVPSTTQPPLTTPSPSAIMQAQDLSDRVKSSTVSVAKAMRDVVAPVPHFTGRAKPCHSSFLAETHIVFASFCCGYVCNSHIHA
eukprot:m.143540 g.143540  ORF g.143540 m.143540 type:complete len:187 (-) comp14099_c0_seq2:2252-2812(-)